MEALQLQAVEAVGQVGYEAADAARAVVRKEATYRGIKRTSVNPRTGMPYVRAMWLHNQIWRGDIAIRGTRISVPVGLLPATGRGRQMAPHWYLINYGRASRNWSGRRRIFSRYKPALMFPKAAWRSPEAKITTGHGGLRRGGYSFDYVDWPGVSRPHWFMQRGFGKAMARSYDIMQRSMGAAMRSWGQR